MDGQTTPVLLPAASDKFKLWHKWFWVGIIITFINAVVGLIYGFALFIEKEHRQEGIIIMIWAVICLATWALLKTIYS